MYICIILKGVSLLTQTMLLLFVLYEGSKAAKSIEISLLQNLRIGGKKFMSTS